MSDPDLNCSIPSSKIEQDVAAQPLTRRGVKERALAPAAADTPAAVAEEATEAVPEPVAAFPTPHPNPECVPEPIPEDPNIPPVTADDWSKGSDDALVTFVAYGDFQ